MLTVTYDPILIIASVLIAIMASFTGLRLMAGIGGLGLQARRVAIAKAAVALGSGIWSMHFVGMLAVKLPVVLVYDALPTLLSALIAILVVGVGLLLLHFGVRTRMRIAVAGLLTGIGIVSMHYIGMAAVRGNCIVSYDPIGVLLATGIAVLASILALELAYHRRTLGLTLIGAVVLGLTITAMHYTAMLWTTFLPGGGIEVVPEPSLSSGTLALIVALAAFVICGLFLLMTVPLGISPGEFSAAPTGTSAAAAAAGAMPAAPSEEEEADRRSTRDSALSKAFTPSPPGIADRKPPRIPYQQDDAIRFLSPDDILAIRAQGHYTGLINGAAGELFCPWALSKLEKTLEGAPFLRTHRSFLVNLRHVTGFRREGDKGFCLLGDGAAIKEIPVSRSQIQAVEKALGLD
ncbi:MAG: MHYT domain-containing protein [Alphaproteobacteria bacterium]